MYLNYFPLIQQILSGLVVSVVYWFLSSNPAAHHYKIFLFIYLFIYLKIRTMYNVQCTMY